MTAKMVEEYSTSDKVKAVEMLLGNDQVLRYIYENWDRINLKGQDTSTSDATRPMTGLT